MKSRRWITGIKKLAVCVIMVLTAPLFADEQVFEFVNDGGAYCLIKIKGNNIIYCTGTTVYTSEDSLSLEVSGTIRSSGNYSTPGTYMNVTVIDSKHKSQNISTSGSLNVSSDNYYTIWVNIYKPVSAGQGSIDYKLSERYPFTLNIIKDINAPAVHL